MTRCCSFVDGGAHPLDGTWSRQVLAVVPRLVNVGMGHAQRIHARSARSALLQHLFHHRGCRSSGRAGGEEAVPVVAHTRPGPVGLLGVAEDDAASCSAGCRATRHRSALSRAGGARRALETWVLVEVWLTTS